MDIRDTENLIESFKNKPWFTLFVIVVFLALLSGIAWFNGFFSEKGKQVAGSVIETPHITNPSKVLPREHSMSESSPVKSQHAEGDQAPIVKVGAFGQSTIKYGSTTHIEQKSEGEQSQNIITKGNVDIRIDNAKPK